MNLKLQLINYQEMYQKQAVRWLRPFWPSSWTLVMISNIRHWFSKENFGAERVFWLLKPIVSIIYQSQILRITIISFLVISKWVFYWNVHDIRDMGNCKKKYMKYLYNYFYKLFVDNYEDSMKFSYQSVSTFLTNILKWTNVTCYAPLVVKSPLSVSHLWIQN